MHPLLRELSSVFRSEADKRRAHGRAADVLTRASYDPGFWTEALSRFLQRPGALNTLNYPVLAVPIMRTIDFELIANCWIPLPDRRTDLSTKAIHHHGHLLLTTVTSHGPGYEHWLFDRLRRIEGDLFEARLVDRAPHRTHRPAFVDAFIPHCPFYPSSLSITYALWSSDGPTSWQEVLKQTQVVQASKEYLLPLIKRLRLAERLHVNVVENFDFYPVEGGLRVMTERLEFARGPNRHFLDSLFNVLQDTGNEGLSGLIRASLNRGEALENRPYVERLLQRLERGEPVVGRLSPGHYDVPHSNFTREAAERAAPWAQVN
jgi:hypothetical protein